MTDDLISDSSDFTWSPSRYALWSGRWGGINDEDPIAVMLRHPTAPFPDKPYPVDQIDDDEIQALATAYLQQANTLALHPPLELPQSWLDALDNPQPSSIFRWLPVGWPPIDVADTNAGEPYVSFRVDRGSDQTIVLLASYASLVASDASSDAGERVVCIGPELGIRVVLHARPSEDDGFEIRITGMSAAFLPGQNNVSELLERFSNVEGGQRVVGPAGLFIDTLAVEAEIAMMLGAVPGTAQIRGFRPLTQGNSFATARVTATIDTGTGPALSYSTVNALSLQAFPQIISKLRNKVELAADASSSKHGYAWIFDTDPASQADATFGGIGYPSDRRPGRPDKALDQYRENEKISNRVKAPLEYPPWKKGQKAPSPDHPDEMWVVMCPGYVLGDKTFPSGDPHQIVDVDLPDIGYNTPRSRSRDFAAISAFANIRQLFWRLEAYGLNNAVDTNGIPTFPYFRLTKLPLKVHYRSGIRPGPGKDGQTVNACVLGEGWPVNYIGPTKIGQRPGVEVHLALGDLTRRRRERWDVTKKRRQPAQPLGISADPRWMWHEIGHVLLMASTGELEFRFAHSAGDALAAIVADPDSCLAADPKWRGATFPWVFEPRRHDRCACQGWSWGGLFHYDCSRIPNSQGARRKGYSTEQILSSSLFRLYRCIGGDTASDLDVRQSASHYCVYLIMRGIQILGAADIIPTYKPDQFVSALIDADIGTETWDVVFPPDSESEFERLGGCVHKVIRWAFEIQGMYTHSAGTIINGPGKAPPVDIYIASRRPSAGDGVWFGPGSYAPVPLDWSSSEDMLAPGWQAASDAIYSYGNGLICVVVGNRGSEPAIDVEVDVWWHEWQDDDPPPDWNDDGWVALEADDQVQVIGPSETAMFCGYSFPDGLPATRYVVLAKATCADDRANIDPETCLPCSRDTPRIALTYLVANDNNLGLAVFYVPSE
jgi:hypothetical protein